jgi:hypothetical protein
VASLIHGRLCIGYRGGARPCDGWARTSRSSGQTLMLGLARPSAEMVWVYLEPRVWVLGIGFGFSALRCVALLCAVCV